MVFQIKKSRNKHMFSYCPGSEGKLSIKPIEIQQFKITQIISNCKNE